MTGFDLQKMIDELPPGLDRAVLRILGFHLGREAAISRADLLMELGNHGFRVPDRAARAAINQLRKLGNPICSAGGEGGGYYLARGWNELVEFIDREMHSRAMDLLEQEKALRKEGERRWGAQEQMSLF